jgi:hypothetical protein
VCELCEGVCFPQFFPVFVTHRPPSCYSHFWSRLPLTPSRKLVLRGQLHSNILPPPTHHNRVVCVFTAFGNFVPVSGAPILNITFRLLEKTSPVACSASHAGGCETTHPHPTHEVRVSHSLAFTSNSARMLKGRGGWKKKGKKGKTPFFGWCPLSSLSDPMPPTLSNSSNLLHEKSRSPGTAFSSLCYTE